MRIILNAPIDCAAKECGDGLTYFEEVESTASPTLLEFQNEAIAYFEGRGWESEGNDVWLCVKHTTLRRTGWDIQLKEAA